MNDIYNTNYSDLLPESLKNDKNMVAFAKAFEQQAKKNMELIDKTIIYFYIDQLPGEVLDVLAQDLKAEWYSKAYDLETKRRIIKNAVKVHKYKGTLYAVKTAINDVLPGTRVREWFETGGEPYTFSIDLATGGRGFTEEQINQILQRVEYYKNKRSHLNKVAAKVDVEGGEFTAAVMNYGVKVTIEPYQQGEYTAIASAAAAVGAYFAFKTTIQEG